MDWTEKCATCAKSGHLINQGIYFACFNDKCEYEPLPKQEFYTTSTYGTASFVDNEIISYEEVEGPEFEYQMEATQIEQETPDNLG